jgi:rod shape-determining protein MreC
MQRKPHLILLISVSLAVLVILALPAHTRSRVRVAISSLFLPLFGLAGSVHAVAERAVSAATPREVLLDRIEVLEKENNGLRLAIAEAQAAMHENDRLRQMVGYAPRLRWNLRPAHVIGRDPANWWRSVHIDVGLRHGVTNNLAVLTPDGLVGRVAECSAWTSRVILVGDPNCPVGAALAERGETGIIRGASAGDIEGTLVDLTYLSRNAAVSPGQQVVTSGQGGVFPRGIRIGDVLDARMVGDGIFLEARVRLAVDPGALDLVWVKLP